ncbi:ScyD/ScyE family protein [Dyadobacter chenwenxiniae]|uniref:ScyD/ScyE family protein n=1 Tax=Dyadobacter chenwenxiniae TaxID=2906456 RepID=A0A9X1PNN2_9BACT|nr:ScyD/ScyE family protein [Dyadobacter chenwenxiniae]MCF0052173.1 ScyD/ScyE family protein [Dyadobacter chenwenxiniae]MCF0062883.1 ScyD/ScyE family protein [Dyadobacter chenwenxiniae]UON84942.1 ScyD/ScyE family protein [Dyadobacter chenwenxiniae]
MKSARLLGLAFFVFASALSCTDHAPDPVEFQSAEFSKGTLLAPIAITKGDNNTLWVTEQGSATDQGDTHDGAVSMIGADGTVHRAITGFLSKSSVEKMPSGLTHLLYKDGMLYILHGVEGRLYKANVSAWKPGDAPLKAMDLSYEDLGSFVKAQFPDPATAESNLYNLAWGPGGDLFITDAAGNMIIRRKSDGSKSVFATFPDFDNPKKPVGGPTVDFVPTGIAWDGSKFFVTSLTGFPFNAGLAEIKTVDQMGSVSDYKKGFTTLVDVVLTDSNKPLVLHFSDFSPSFIFEQNKGTVNSEDGGVVLAGLNMPTDIEKVYTNTYYVVSLGNSKVYKLTY